ncbi:MAG: transporter substrate-binding domain-containing protein, partial [Acidobacteria bacterium]|nr:transporter substrate-binding domain-containing protein [Acidobacteriota bacterium]
MSHSRSGRGRSARLSLFAACLLVLLLAGLSPWLKSRLPQRPLRVAASNSPPYYTIDPDGRPRGLAVDVLNEVSRRRNIPIEWVIITTPLAEALRSGTVDLVPVASVNARRKEDFHLSQPWLENRFCLLSLRGGPV